ncbi:hypothetical protein BN946_scf185013.g108 [Trametes cinnabarina]|uniref:RRM domain-containing protein n=1 Tax=Pycnoporus cinnabarinus TaxID=5643 RepID=A0A060SM34_PYCCI|nr:hypothetical protein BN946_scf185013.g108 [Trametes cinnabarina]
MSAAQKLTKKQKKALAFRERKGKGKPKSFDELDNDVPVEENQDLAEAEVDAEAGAVEAPARRAAGAQKAGAQAQDAVEGGNAKGKKRKREDGAEQDGVGAKEQKAKKKRKGANGEGVDTGDEAEGESKSSGKKDAKRRYILFVGNLKYTTTKEAVQQHFSKCDPPPTVRLMTPKPSANSRPTAKSKGFAFVEFAHKNALQQGLKLHQTELDGRKINVELTAGGGGKSELRLEKVKKRNKELHEQRKKNLLKQKSGKRKPGGEGGDGEEEVQLERPQRYSATCGVEQVPLKKRTWSVPEGDDEEGPSRKRGTKKGKKRPPKPLGTGVNAIPVG